MLLIKISIGTLLGALYFFAISGWKKDGSPWFRARRATGWWGLITAEIMITTIGVPHSYAANLDQSKKLIADIIIGSASWLALGLTTSLIFGLATYIILRSRNKK